MNIHCISPCLWFNDQAEDAARFYTGIFPNSRIESVSRYGEAGREFHGKPPGSVMAVAFVLHEHYFTALNGGSVFRFSEAISLQVQCTSQEAIDYYWERLSAGGDHSAQQCGWLKDRYGLSWQVVPKWLQEALSDSDPARSQRVMLALLQMDKLDLATLQAAYRGA